MFEAAMNTRVVCGHRLLQPQGMGRKWISRAPLERGSANILVCRMREEGARYGILVERSISGRNVGTLTVHASLDDLRAQMGADKVGKKFGGKDVAMKDDRTVMAFEFPTPREIGVKFLRHPLTGVNYPQARGLALAMGLDLPTYEEFLWVLQGFDEGNFFTSPGNPDFRKYVHCSIGTQEIGPIDVEDQRYKDQPHGTRHWLGNVWKWMLRDFAEQYQFALRGGGFHYSDPKVFAPSFRINVAPVTYNVDLGLVCVDGSQSGVTNFRPEGFFLD